MTTESEILIRAAERISVLGQWCQGMLARDANGVSQWEDSRYAVAWCLLGASELEARKAELTESNKMMTALHVAARARAPGFESAGDFNDAPNRTAAECAQFLRDVAAQFEKGSA